ncbi:MAG: Ig-like domain-containing protein [Oscillospiraceae bacterium]|nr:Ig-like domain-containing protein [Oscillospiraceae bacterium]
MRWDLQIYLSVDLIQAGVGSSGGFSGETHEKYRIYSKQSYVFTYCLSPIHVDQNSTASLMQQAQTRRTAKPSSSAELSAGYVSPAFSTNDAELSAIVELPDVAVATTVGCEPELPTSITAVRANGATSSVGVLWQTYTPQQIAASGSCGTVEDAGIIPNCVVTVH